MFYRKVLDKLKDWSESEYRKVLILRGARQVGKTTAVRMFAKEFDTYIELNLEIPDEKRIFDKFDNIQKLYDHILLKKQIKPKGKRILLFIDEIQNSSEAMKSLRFFHEQMPSLYVIASGSVLDIYLYREKFEIAVGRVDYLKMHPMSFDEYLLASKNEGLLRSAGEVPIIDHVLPLLREHFVSYALLGGMPEAVRIRLESNDISKAQNYLESLLLAYRDDIVKYAHTSEQAAVLQHLLDTSFSEIGKEITFEGFGASTYRSQTIKNAFQILERALLVNLIYPYTSVTLPAIAKLRKRPKLLYLDIGLVNQQSKVMAEYFSADKLDSVYRGRAVEQIVGQMITVLQMDYDFEFSFWKRDVRGSAAEIDYVIIYQGKMIPVEVKAGKTGTLKSLMIFMEKSPYDLAVRIYDGEIKKEKLTTASGKRFTLINLPIPLTHRLMEYIKSGR